MHDDKDYAYFIKSLDFEHPCKDITVMLEQSMMSVQTETLMLLAMKEILSRTICCQKISYKLCRQLDESFWYFTIERTANILSFGNIVNSN